MAVVLTALGAVTVACGQKGPPLAPLHLVPAAVSEMSVRRVADRARIRFVLPSRNENGPGRLELDHVEIYAMTIPANSVEPSLRELMTTDRRVGEIAVRPVLEEGEAAPPDEKRPEAGTPVTFDEELTTQKLTPVPVTTPAALPPATAAAPGAAATTAGAPTTTAATAPATTAPATAAAAAAPATTAPAAAAPATTAPTATAPATTTPAAAPAAGTPAPAPPATAGSATVAAPSQTPPVKPGGPPAPAAVAVPPKPATVPYERRLYVARGVTRQGRPGAVSPLTSLPLVGLAPPPANVRVRFTETVLTVEWDPQATATAYNVYRGDELLQPVNPAPLKSPVFEQAGITFGQEQCYRVRSAASLEPAIIEGEASPPQCVTPRDQFAPAAPRGLAAVPTTGQISLIWDANTEKDLAGYIILRGETPEALAAITPAPIKETSYRDTTVKPGVRYVYAIVATDTATPPNVSAQSARVEETAR
jgi:hypothetical protein